jgi:hypothetical protein
MELVSPKLAFADACGMERVEECVGVSDKL